MNRRMFAGFGLAAVGGIFVPQTKWWGRFVEQPVVVVPTHAPSTQMVYSEFSKCWVTYSWTGVDGLRHRSVKEGRCVGGVVTVDWGMPLQAGLVAIRVEARA